MLNFTRFRRSEGKGRRVMRLLLLGCFLFPVQIVWGGGPVFLDRPAACSRISFAWQENLSPGVFAEKENASIRCIRRKRLTFAQVRELALSATRNPDSKKVLLGRYFAHNDSSYNVRAGKEYTFFELKNWDEIYKQVGFNYSQMWRISKRFMKNQMKQQKDFYFSHDPNVPGGKGFSMEVAYLKKKKKGIRFVRKGNLWKAVW